MMRVFSSALWCLPALLLSTGGCADKRPTAGTTGTSSGSAGSHVGSNENGGSSGTSGGSSGTSSGSSGSSGTSGGSNGTLPDGGGGSSGTLPDGGSELDDEFEGNAVDSAWTALNTQMVASTVSGDVLRMTPNRNCVWFHADEGPGLIKLVTGDFKVTANVRARRASNPSMPAPGIYQFAGLIARDPAGSTAHENYVFTVMGERGGWLTNETKNTIRSSSDVHGPNEGRKHADAELRICRIGQVFRLYNRPPAGGPWKLESTYDRKGAPLPETLEVGPIAYTYTNSPDLVGEFDYVRFGTVTTVADCTAD